MQNEFSGMFVLAFRFQASLVRSVPLHERKPRQSGNFQVSADESVTSIQRPHGELRVPVSVFRTRFYSRPLFIVNYPHFPCAAYTRHWFKPTI